MHTLSPRSLCCALAALAVALMTQVRAAVARAQLTTTQATLTLDARGLSLALHFAHNFAIGYCIKKIWTPRRVGAGWYIPSPRTLYTRARDTRSQDDRRICVSDNRRVERCWSRLHPTRVFFDPASRASASHSHASKTRAAGRPGTARPNRPSSMIRQAITASRAMARSSVAASWC